MTCSVGAATGRRHIEPPRTIDLVIDEPQGRVSPTVLHGIRHDLRQPQHVHAMLLRTLQLRAAGTELERDVGDVANAARVLLERYDAGRVDRRTGGALCQRQRCH
jgi:hypothetical protein